MTNLFLPIAAILAGWLIVFAWLSVPFSGRDLRLALSPAREAAKDRLAGERRMSASARSGAIMTDNVRSS